MKRFMKWLLVAPLLLTLAACGLSGEIEERASRLNAALSSLVQTLDVERKSFATLQGDVKAWEFFSPYALREGWESSFDAAAADVKGLQDRFVTEVAPILNADNEEDETKLAQLLTGIESNLKPAEEKIKVVKTRMSLLRNGYDNAPQWIADSRQYLETIKAVDTALRPVIEKTKIDFAIRSADIDMRFAPLSKIVVDAKAQLALAEAEYAKHATGTEADYAVFADAVTFLKTNSVSFAELDVAYREDLDSLYRDYTLILRDMKVEYAVTIGRASWDSASDWDTTHEYLFAPVSISQSDFEYLSSLGAGEGSGEQGMLASYAAGWSSWKTSSYIDAAVWKRLQLDPGESWPTRDDNESSFWIEDLEPVYFHKYAEISGTVVTEGEWEEVDEADYGARVDDFGMALETKPLGQFADEPITEATPVGIDMVGDARYGEWQTDTTGNSFWHYYGQYAFFNSLLGNNSYYYRSDYDDYRRWRNDRGNSGAVYGWYGRDRSSPVWGSSGTFTTKTDAYKTSPFAAGGGVKSVTPNLREAGESARSRGPGDGGK